MTVSPHESHQLILEAIRATRDDLGGRLDTLAERVGGVERHVAEQNGRIRKVEVRWAEHDGREQGAKDATSVQRVEVQDRRQRLAPAWQLLIALVGVTVGAVLGHVL